MGRHQGELEVHHGGEGVRRLARVGRHVAGTDWVPPVSADPDPHHSPGVEPPLPATPEPPAPAPAPTVPAPTTAPASGEVLPGRLAVRPRDPWHAPRLEPIRSAGGGA